MSKSSKRKSAMSKRHQGLAGACAITLLWVSSSCTKERPFEAMLKENVEDKSVIDTDSEFVYVPSVLESSRTTTASRPHWMGEAKIVKLKITERSLDVVEIEKDARFTGNETNQKLVMSIPISHVDYKCQENSVGECSHKEVENDKITWDKKSKFKPDFGGIKVTEINTLPVEMRNFFGMGSCYSETASRVISAKMEKDAINIEVERSFNSTPACAGDVQELSDLSFSVRYHYSMAKLDKLVSKEYQAVTYPQADQGEFGFFTTDIHTLSSDNRERQADELTYMNRWNPNREKLVYYLSEGFNKPENAALKKATEQGVAAINQAFRQAGSSLQVELRDPSPEVKPGDIRHSMVIMVEDPVAIGLLGYGPTLANPKTGEILSGRVVMYPGVLRKTIRNTYEELRTQQLLAGIAKAEAEKKAASAGTPASERNARFPEKAVYARGLDVPVMQMSAFSSGKESIFGKSLKRRSADSGAARVRLSAESRAELHEMLSKASRNVTPAEKLQDRVEAASKHCVYLADNVNFPEVVARGIREKIPGGELKPWENLSESERQEVLNVLMPYVWTPTFVHEMGHNLGLRHNFNGSEDKANFYSREELAKMGIDHEIPYSSVMDYAGRSINELPTMGKYDVAALRFGYGRKVEDANGNLVEVASTLAETKAKARDVAIKEYKFCTDEHVSLNVGCKRFDEGTTWLEIAKYQIKDYHDRYRFRNFRNGARSFSKLNDAGYASGVEDTFSNLRMYLEVYERISTRFQIPEDEWKTDPFLKELMEAVQLSAQFFMDVILTPDVHCALQVDGAEQARIVPLEMISADAASCSEVQFRKGVTLLGQAGRSFQHKKLRSNPNSYEDQIDIRGIWIDKLLAAKYLFDRKLGISSLDHVSMNYLDVPGVGEKVAAMMSSIILNENQAPITFTTVDGAEKVINLAYKLSTKESQLINIQDRSLRRLLDLPNEDTLLARELVNRAFSEMPHLLAGSSANRFLDSFAVHTYLPQDGRAASDFIPVTAGGKQLFVGKENSLAKKLAANLQVVQALQSMEMKDITDHVESLKKVLAAEVAPEPQKLQAKSEIQVVEQFLAGGFESEEFYSLMLSEVLKKK